MTEEAFTLVFGLELPSWPPRRRWRLVERAHESGGVVIDLDASGRFLVSVSWTDHPDDTQAFEAIYLSGGPVVVLSVQGTPASIRLRINGRELAPYRSGQKLMPLITGGKGSRARVLRYPTLRVSQAEDRIDQLFLGKVMELDQKLQVGDWFSLLSASAIIRGLIADGNPIVHTVNQRYHLKLRYRAVGRTVDWPKLSSSYSLWLAGTAMGPASRLVSLEEFLRTPCFVENNQIVATVNDLIKLCANVMGGVHLGEVQLPEHVALSQFADGFSGPQANANERAIASIGEAVLEGVAPLVDAIVGRAQQLATI